jgi:SAM-dependent methyltransferase
MPDYIHGLARRIKAGAAAISGRRGEGRYAARTLQSLLNGYRNTALLYVAARLGLADALADGPMSSAELAQKVGAHAPSLHRVLKGLVTLGVCSEASDGRFRLTEFGAGLRSDRADSVRGLAILCGEEYAIAWGGLLHSVMTGEPAVRRVLGMTQLEHRALHPELEKFFSSGLASAADHVAAAVLKMYDFEPYRTVADIGGGHGALLAGVLGANPSMAGILFERPSVIAGARAYLESKGVAARCRIVEGDFFDRLPEGADAFVLKSIIHDWDDEQALAILRNCHRALGARGRLLLIERLLPARAEDDPGAILVDLQMLTLTGGRERSKEEYRGLLSAAGFTMSRVFPTESGFSILEAARSQQGV